MENLDSLHMEGISKSYDGTQALREVDFSAALSEVHAIAGENGAGKSTLVKILSGAVKRDAGEILTAYPGPLAWRLLGFLPHRA